MAYDPVRRSVVLFGGLGAASLQDTWEWDGAARNWADVTPSEGKPIARFDAAMTYDTDSGRMLLFGGYGSGYRQDTWEWDGGSRAWFDVSPAFLNPSARASRAIAYDSARVKAVLFGGEGSGILGDTWEWDRGKDSSPAVFFRINVPASGNARSSSIGSISTAIYSGGVGYPGGVATNGVDLKVWEEGIWKTIATNNGPPEAPSLVFWTTADPQVISRLFFGDQQTLNFAVTPTAPNGTGTGEVSVDYAEVTVNYRLP